MAEGRRGSGAVLSRYARATLIALRRSLAPDEAEALRLRCNALVADLTTQPAPTTVDGAAFAEARLAASSSASSPAARRAFAVANDRVMQWVAAEAPLTLEELRALNGAVRGLDGPAPLRRGPMTLDGASCPSPDAIAALLAPMLDAVAVRSREIHPIAGAGLLYQWLVTVHAFDDGNGRTARLAVDHHLGLAGLPPACIGTAIDDFVSVHAQNEFGVTPDAACGVVLRGLERTATLLWPTFRRA